MNNRYVTQVMTEIQNRDFYGESFLSPITVTYSMTEDEAQSFEAKRALQIFQNMKLQVLQRSTGQGLVECQVTFNPLTIASMTSIRIAERIAQKGQ